MNQIEFGKKCRSLNKKYFEFFGETPSPSDFNQPYRVYLNALEKAVNERVKLERILAVKLVPKGMKS